MKKLQELVSKLFKTFWKCELSKISHSLLTEYDKSAFAKKLDIVPLHLEVRDGVTMICENNNMLSLLDLLHGTSRQTLGEHYYQAVKVSPIETVLLTTAQIADLISKEGSVTLLNPLDSVQIYDDVEAYLTFINEAEVHSPHFQKPPENDLNAFKRLLSLIESMAYLYKENGMVENHFLRLRRMGTLTATGQLTTKLQLNGLTSQSLLVNDHEKSPYNFK